MDTFFCQIITPEREFFKGRIEMLTLDTISGEVGILPHHIPMVFALKAGSIRIKQDGKWRISAGGEGFAEVTPDGVTVLTETVFWPEEIETELVRGLIKDRQYVLEHAKNYKEYQIAEAGLARAFARLKVKNKTQE